MKTSAIIIMVFMITFLWGGFLFLVNKAYKKEKISKRKQKEKNETQLQPAKET